MQSVLDYPLVYTQHVAWGDMDAFGHVNNVMYYRYVDSAFRMRYLLWSEQQQAFVAEAEAVIVCVDKTNMQKTLIPELVRQKLKEFELTVGHQI